MSVLQLAYSKGTENIIRVVSGIGPSMVGHVTCIIHFNQKPNFNLFFCFVDMPYLITQS